MITKKIRVAFLMTETLATGETEYREYGSSILETREFQLPHIIDISVDVNFKCTADNIADYLHHIDKTWTQNNRDSVMSFIDVVHTRWHSYFCLESNDEWPDVVIKAIMDRLYPLLTISPKKILSWSLFE